MHDRAKDVLRRYRLPYMLYFACSAAAGAAGTAGAACASAAGLGSSALQDFLHGQKNQSAAATIAAATSAKRTRRHQRHGAQTVNDLARFIEKRIGRFTAQPHALRIAPMSRFRSLNQVRITLGSDTTRMSATTEIAIWSADI